MAINTVNPGVAIYQLTPTGFAAQHMAEATGREVSTISAFLSEVSEETIGNDSVVVLGESSTIDVILFYLLLRHIPPGTRLILVGDPSEVPPIGPGLVLHALAGHPAVPQTELVVVKHQSDPFDIHLAAAAVRHHKHPEFAPFNGRGSGVSFISCPETALNDTVTRLHAELGGSGEDYSVQVLPTTISGPGGVQQLNLLLRDQYRKTAEPVLHKHAEFGVVQAATRERIPLRVGDLVIFTKNDYTLGLRNGSLGRITRASPVGDKDGNCCTVDFEGVEYIFNSTQLQALSHSYAVIAQKAQGSRFSRVIVPIRASRLLDQAMIYTAITRGIDQVVLVGNQAAAIAAILAPAPATQRHVSLPARLAGTFLRGGIRL